MASRTGSILRSYKVRDKYNILLCPTHERYESNLSLTNHNFFAWRGSGIKDWEVKYARVPKNYHLLAYYDYQSKLPEEVDLLSTIPIDIDIDFCLSANKFGQFQVLSRIAKMLQVPLVSIEHTMPYDRWSSQYIDEITKMKGDINIFISEFSKDKWRWNDKYEIIHHGIDTELFKPDPNVEREKRILSVVNDWINRDEPCGFSIWRKVTQGLPVYPIGDTPGLSKPAPHIRALVRAYQSSLIFINTSRFSPIPTSLLEAMSCGCIVVTTDNCVMSSLIVQGYNGLKADNEYGLRILLEQVLENPEKFMHLGVNARKTILEKYSLGRFLQNWNNVFDKAAEIGVTK